MPRLLRKTFYEWKKENSNTEARNSEQKKKKK
jgi:hypothetical protein